MVHLNLCNLWRYIHTNCHGYQNGPSWKIFIFAKQLRWNIVNSPMIPRTLSSSWLMSTCTLGFPLPVQLVLSFLATPVFLVWLLMSLHFFFISVIVLASCLPYKYKGTKWPKVCRWDKCGCRWDKSGRAHFKDAWDDKLWTLLRIWLIGDHKILTNSFHSMSDVQPEFILHFLCEFGTKLPH